MKIIAYIAAAILIFFGVLFIWGAGGAQGGGWTWVCGGALSVLLGFGFIWFASRQPRVAGDTNVTLKVDLPAQTKIEQMTCKNCGGALKAENIKMVAGTVLKQSLKPGSQVCINETVLLVYAVVPHDEPASGEIVLPDFTGAPIQRVEVFLRETGLVLGPVHERVTSEQRPGTVLGQKPPAKTRVAKGTEVLLLVAVGVADEGSVLPAPEQSGPKREGFSTTFRVPPSSNGRRYPAPRVTPWNSTACTAASRVNGVPIWVSRGRWYATSRW